MTIAQHLVTADELLHQTDDGFRYELVRGELRRMSPASHKHGRMSVNITTPLDRYVRENDLGAVYAAETGFRVATDPDTVLAPDAAFVRRERVEAIGDTDGFWPGAPDLAVEVVSRHDLYTEVEEKVIDWLEAGARMVVVINPRRRTVSVYRSLTDITILTERDTLEGADVVPGWRLPVRNIFA
ncbi:MAG: Uma2 family endonuclease [Thermomicrobiales bacterium]